MAEPHLPLPLIPFSKTTTTSRDKQVSFPLKLHRPSLDRQFERLTPKFDRLQQAFEARRLSVQNSPSGAAPELTLVFEVAGSVERFYEAVRAVRGMEWVGDIEQDFDPTVDFHHSQAPEQPVTGHAYLIFSDFQAKDQLLSLYRRYRANDKVEFERGLAPWKQVFNRLLDLRPWGAVDRLRETGLLEDWQESLAQGAETVRAEVELWYHQLPSRRRRQQEQLLGFFEAQGTTVLAGPCQIASIAYHAVLISVTRAQAEALLTTPFEIELVQAEQVMFFHPASQMSVPILQVEPEADSEGLPEQPVPEEPTDSAPLVALFDGLPLENHTWLRNRLIVDDPDNWSAEIPAAMRQHGTAMASLILHGDLSAPNSPLQRPIYTRPILQPSANGRWEQLPGDLLSVDLLHQAVRRLCEGDGAEPAVAPSVRVVNLSIGDSARPFIRTMSPLARLLDWLAHKYNLLILVSAGNHPEAIEFSTSRDEFRTMAAEERTQATWQVLLQGRQHRRLLSPAEAVNALTIGGEHSDLAANIGADHRVDLSPHQEQILSPITAFGGGYRRAVKPEAFFPAGRQLFAEQLGTDGPATLRPRQILLRPPGQKAASPGREGSLETTYFSCGTSNATALATGLAARIAEHYSEIVEDSRWEDMTDGCRAATLKTFLVHSCDWGPISEFYAELLPATPGRSAQKRDVAPILGYGFPEPVRLFGCTEQRISLLSHDRLSPDEAHLYRLPLPPALTSTTVWRRLTITLGWLSGVTPLQQRYRQDRLWFELDFKDLGLIRMQDHDAPRRGTIQHEIFEGDSAVTGEAVEIRVQCRKDARKQGIGAGAPYALLVTLEVAPSEELPIYQQVRSRIVAARAQIRSR